MSVRMVDSFDHYATGDALLKWSTNTSFAISAGNGRNGTSSFRRSWDGAFSKVFDNQATWIVGFAFRFTAAASRTILIFFDAGTDQVDIRMDNSRHLIATRNGTVLATGTTVLSSGQYYYIEFKATIHPTAGVVVVKINGVTEINLSSQNTRASANSTADTIQFHAAGFDGSGSVNDIDDVYICDGVDQSIAQPGSPANNDFLGDVRIEALFPNGDGNSSVLVGSDGNSVNNSLLVDEATPNGDTDYVTSATPGDKDTYAYTNLTPTAGTVLAVQIMAEARKDDAGARSIVTVARSGGTEQDGPVKTLTTTYNYHMDVRGAKPGAAAWSITDVNAAEFGVKVNA